jgi:hypothetical protein
LHEGSDLPTSLPTPSRSFRAKLLVHIQAKDFIQIKVSTTFLSSQQLQALYMPVISSFRVGLSFLLILLPNGEPVFTVHVGTLPNGESTYAERIHTMPVPEHGRPFHAKLLEHTQTKLFGRLPFCGVHHTGRDPSTIPTSITFDDDNPLTLQRTESNMDDNGLTPIPTIVIHLIDRDQTYNTPVPDHHQHPLHVPTDVSVTYPAITEPLNINHLATYDDDNPLLSMPSAITFDDDNPDEDWGAATYIDDLFASYTQQKTGEFSLESHDPSSYTANEESTLHAYTTTLASSLPTTAFLQMGRDWRAIAIDNTTAESIYPNDIPEEDGELNPLVESYSLQVSGHSWTDLQRSWFPDTDPEHLLGIWFIRPSKVYSRRLKGSDKIRIDRESSTPYCRLALYCRLVLQAFTTLLTK